MGQVPEPKHREVRHHGFHTEVGVGHSVTTSVTDTYCAHCHQWVETNGVLGPLRFMAWHDHGTRG